MGDAQSQSPIPVPALLTDGGRGDVDNHNYHPGEKSFSGEEECVLGISDINENPLVSFVESGDGDEEGPLAESEELIGISDQDEVPLVAVGETEEEEEEEQFFSTDEFASADNAVDWDMLMSRGGMQTQQRKTHWERDSLYVKFDPLIASKREAADRMSFVFKAPKPPGLSSSMKSISENNSMFSESGVTGSSYETAREDMTASMLDEVSIASPARSNGIDESSNFVTESLIESEEPSLSDNATAQETENAAHSIIIETEEQSPNDNAVDLTPANDPKSPIRSPKPIPDNNGNGPPGTPGNVTTTSPVCSEESIHNNGNANATFDIPDNDTSSAAIIEGGTPKDEAKNQSVQNNVSFSMSMLADGLMNMNLIEDGTQSDSDSEQRPHNSTISMMSINEASPKANTTNQSVLIQVASPSPNGLNETGQSQESDIVESVGKGVGNLNLAEEASLLNDGFLDQNANNGGGDSSHLNTSMTGNANNGGGDSFHLNTSMTGNANNGGGDSFHLNTSMNGNANNGGGDSFHLNTSMTGNANNGSGDSSHLNTSMTGNANNGSGDSSHLNTSKNSIIDTQPIGLNEDAPTQAKSPAAPTMSAEQTDRLARITKLKEQLAELKLKDVEHKKAWKERLARKELELCQKVKDFNKKREAVEATERELEKATQEHEQAVEDHRDMESMFSELYMLYDQFRKLENRLGENSHILEQREAILQQILKKREERDYIAEQEFQKVIETMKQDFEQILRERQDENARLNAKGRMSELQTSKLEAGIAQAEKANMELQVLCNDLVQEQRK